MIVGNVRVSDEVEVYSPNGKCSYNLRRVPTPIIPQPLLVNRKEILEKSGFKMVLSCQLFSYLVNVYFIVN